MFCAYLLVLLAVSSQQDFVACEHQLMQRVPATVKSGGRVSVATMANKHALMVKTCEGTS